MCVFFFGGEGEFDSVLLVSNVLCPSRRRAGKQRRSNDQPGRRCFCAPPGCDRPGGMRQAGTGPVRQALLLRAAGQAESGRPARGGWRRVVVVLFLRLFSAANRLRLGWPAAPRAANRRPTTAGRQPAGARQVCCGVLLLLQLGTCSTCLLTPAARRTGQRPC